MKLTDSQIIKNHESDLLDSIKTDIDWRVIGDIFGKGHPLNIEEDVEYKRGDIVVHNGQIAYKLEFRVAMSLSIVIDREGNYVSVTRAGEGPHTSTDKGMRHEIKDAAPPRETSAAGIAAQSPAESPRERITKMASQVGDILTHLEEEGVVSGVE